MSDIGIHDHEGVSKEYFAFWKANRRGLTPLQMQKPPGARERYDGRLSTPSACFRILQVLTSFSRFDLLDEYFQLATRDSRFTQCSDPNFLIPPSPVLLSSTGRAWQSQTSSPL